MSIPEGRIASRLVVDIKNMNEYIRQQQLISVDIEPIMVAQTTNLINRIGSTVVTTADAAELCATINAGP